MKSHELAKVLLGLPDKPLEIIKGEGQYTSAWEMVGVPWDFWGGTIRIQIQPERERPEQNVKNGPTTQEDKA